MPRRKRQNQLLIAAQSYVDQNIPELKSATLRLRMLDGPPESPRYCAWAEACGGDPCPNGTPPAVAAAGKCPVLKCALRNSIRLLMDRRGVVLQVTRSSIRWS